MWNKFGTFSGKKEEDSSKVLFCSQENINVGIHESQAFKLEKSFYLQNVHWLGVYCLMPYSVCLFTFMCNRSKIHLFEERMNPGHWYPLLIYTESSRLENLLFCRIGGKEYVSLITRIMHFRGKLTCNLNTPALWLTMFWNSQKRQR